MKQLRPIVALLAVAFSSGTALAAPVLKAEIVVEAAVVTMGDMFEDAGANAEAALFRAPQPGTTGSVDLAAIRTATARAGIRDFEVNGILAVTVSRASSIVDETLLAGLITDDLQRRGILSHGMSANVLLARPFLAIHAPASEAPAYLDNLRYHPGNGTFSARFSIAGDARPIDVSGTIAMSMEAPHLVGSLPAGTILGPEHIVMRPVPMQQAEAQGIASMDQLVGKALNRSSRDGMMLNANDVSVPLTVAKNDIVTIYYRQGPMTLTVRGQAVTGASEGAPLQVLNLVSKRVISATAIAAGAVEVSTAPLALAGL